MNNYIVDILDFNDVKAKEVYSFII